MSIAIRISSLIILRSISLDGFNSLINGKRHLLGLIDRVRVAK